MNPRRGGTLLIHFACLLLAGCSAMPENGAVPIADCGLTGKCGVRNADFALAEKPNPQSAIANPHSPIENPQSDCLPIDLPTALRLAGASNLQIALAVERTRQAQARLDTANLQWLPSLTGGVGYTRHEGQIQDTRGEVIDVSRDSLFVGGGPNLGTIGIAGEGTQPRMTVGLSLADAFFAPLAERQQVRGSHSALTTIFNDTLLQVALAYLDLVQARAQLAIAREGLANAEEFDKLVESNVRAGAAPPADGLRAHAELADRRRLVHHAEEAVGVASAELARVLRLDPALMLVPAEQQPLPLCLVNSEIPLPSLIEQALMQRPELAEQRALVSATLARLRQEQARPFIPSVQVGFGAGTFGGAPGSAPHNYGNRTDFDAILVWELRNLGLGNSALTRERTSINQQAVLSAAQTSDRIASEVARAHYQVVQRKLQIDAARDQVQAAAEAVPLNFKGIRGAALRPIEAQQAIQSLVYARNQYLAAVVDYNRAQFYLWRALGAAPDETCAAAEAGSPGPT